MTGYERKERSEVCNKGVRIKSCASQLALWFKASVLQQRCFKAVERSPECQCLPHVK